MTREEREMRTLVRESDVIDRTDGSELAKAFNCLWEKYIEQEPSNVLPDNPTNGDMIKTMFPYIEIEGIGGEIKCIAVSIGLGTSYFALDWWNAPFKRGRE